VAAVTVGVVVIALAVLLAQPSSAWRDAAEHTRRFWVAWALVACTVAAIGPTFLGPGVAGGAWLAGFAGVGVLQPALVADVVDVRILVRRRRWVATLPAAAPVLRPIRWRASSVSEHHPPLRGSPVRA
jgi:hypothetical protein